jgi:hypothetical protein
LDTRSNEINWGATYKDFQFSNTTSYTYYRLYITSVQPYIDPTYFIYYYYAEIKELELYAQTTANFSASTSPINIGGSSTLTWATTNSTAVSINQGIGSVATSGSLSVSPRVPTTYTLTVTGISGTIYKTATVDIYAPAAIMSATPNPIVSGDPSYITWAAINVTSVTLNPGGISLYSNSSGIASINGTYSVTPSSTTTYTLTATGPKSPAATKTVTVTVYSNTTDSDNDGLPDWYEIYTYGNLTSHGISSGSCNCD